MANVYVATTGNDTTGTGLIGAPYATITKAIAVAAASDTIICRGTAPPGSPSTTPTRSEFVEDVTVTKRLTIKNNTGELVRIKGRMFINQSADNTTIQGEYILTGESNGAAYNGLELDGRSTTSGLPSPTVYGTDVTFESVDLTNQNTKIGLSAGYENDSAKQADDLTVHRCRIFKNGLLPPGNHQHGIYMDSNSAGHGAVIYENLFWQNADRGLQLYPNALDCEAYHNILDGNGEGVLFAGGLEDAGAQSSKRNDVHNNVITNSVQRWNIESDWTGATVPSGADLNLATDNHCFNCARETGGEGISVTGVTVSGTTTGDPLYANRTAGDFTMSNATANTTITGATMPPPMPVSVVVATAPPKVQTAVRQLTLSNATASVSVSDLDFEPVAVVFYATTQTAAGFADGQYLGIGFATATEQATICIGSQDGLTDSLTARRGHSGRCLLGLIADNAEHINCTFVSMDDNGFTINYTANDAYIINAFCIGGSDISAKILFPVSPTAIGNGTPVADASGNQAITGAGFQPEFAMSLYNRNSTLTATNATAQLGIGMASGATTNEAALAVAEPSAQATMATSQYQKVGDLVAAMASGGNTVDAEAQLVSFDSDGLTIHWSDYPSASHVYPLLLINGGTWKVSSFNQPTAAGNTTLTAATNKRIRGVFMMGCNAVTNASADATQEKISIGACDPDGAMASIWTQAEDNVADSNTRSNVASTRALGHLTLPSTVDAAITAVSLSPTSVNSTLTWSEDATDTAREVLYAYVSNAAYPTATTLAATAVLTLTATLNASVNPNGWATTYYFEYGTDTSYGSTTTPVSVGSGTSPVSVDDDITGLNDGQTIHYRVVAENEGAIVYGDDSIFTTTDLSEQRMRMMV